MLNTRTPHLSIPSNDELPNLRAAANDVQKPVGIDAVSSSHTGFAIQQLMPLVQTAFTQASNDTQGIEVRFVDGEEDDDALVPLQDAADAAFRRREKLRLRSVIGPRLHKARELSGLSQTEAAMQLGYGAPTQLSLWEMSRRLVPLSELIRAARLYGVSLDYLTGESEEVDRDPSMALRNACLRGVRQQLDRVAEITVSEVARHARLVGPHAGNARNLIHAGDNLVDALGAFVRFNAEEFAGQRGGATVVRRSEEFETALDDARGRIRLHDALDGDLRRALAAIDDAAPPLAC